MGGNIRDLREYLHTEVKGLLASGFSGGVRISALEQLDSKGPQDAFAFYRTVRKSRHGILPMRESTFDDILEGMHKKGQLNLTYAAQEDKWGVSITDEGRDLLKLYREKSEQIKVATQKPNPKF